MRNVNFKRPIIFLSACLFLLGCDEPNVEVGILGKKLAAPVLKSDSPFSQKFDSNNYVHLTGTCDSRVGDLFVSFKVAPAATGTAVDVAKAAQWLTPPISPDITGTTLSPSVTNDVNCADGTFDFYLAKNDLLNMWGVSSDSNVDVQALYIKGSTLIGDTQTLSLLDSSSSGNHPAVALHLDKLAPLGFSASGQCESLNVSVVDSSGNPTSTATDVSVSITEAIGAGSAHQIFAYATWESCNNSLNSPIAGISSFVIPAGQGNIQIIYPMPTASTAIDQTLHYTAVATGFTSGTEDIRLRDPNGAHHYVILDPSAMGPRYHKDICYPFSFDSISYSNRSLFLVAADLPIHVSPTDTKLHFYTSGDCSGSSAADFSISSGKSQVFGSFKFVSTGTEAGDFSRIAVNLSSTDTSFDMAPYNMEIDFKATVTPSVVGLRGPLDLNRAMCSIYTVELYNSSWAAVPATSTTVVGLSSTAAGNFYSDSSCSAGNVTSQVAFAAGDFSQNVYFQPAADAPEGSFTMTASSTGLTSDVVKVQVPVMPPVNFYLGITSISLGVCAPMNITATGAAGPYTQNLTFSYNVLGVPTGTTVQLYRDASCSSAINTGPNAVVSYDGSHFPVYMRAMGSNTGYLNIQITVPDIVDTSNRSQTFTITLAP